MKDKVAGFPKRYKEILEDTNRIEFDQLSDSMTGSLLSTLSASKPNGSFLELGTGSGLSTAWILQGMDAGSTLKTIDNNGKLVAIAKQHLGSDQRAKFIVGRGEELILSTETGSVDFIFADTWPGKYNHLEETLSLLKVGGIYIIDDMLPQDNWPDGHEEKASKLIEYLENRDDLFLTKMCWSTGIIICTKKA
jgi:predicted O-methyltransferase YrrM